MKQYIMGMITGASLIACAFMFMGAKKTLDDISKFKLRWAVYDPVEDAIIQGMYGGVHFIDTEVGEPYLGYPSLRKFERSDWSMMQGAK